MTDKTLVSDQAASHLAPWGFDPSRDCQCYACVHDRGNQEGWGPLDPRWHRMFLCERCGNKRCPHATHHILACTQSNVPGQAGSTYGAEALGADEVVALLKAFGEEAGSISKWAKGRGIHPEVALVVARGLREPSPALLHAMGLTREAIYFARWDSDRSGEAVETTGSTEGESADPKGIAQGDAS